jgi:Zn-dependent protease
MTSRRTPVRLAALAHSFGVAFWLALALTAAALVPALLLPGPARRQAAPARS